MFLRHAIPPILALVLTGSAGGAQAATWPAHLHQAQTYVDQTVADYNAYGTPAYLYYDGASQLRAQVKCGSFVALLLKNSYPQRMTNESLIALTGSSSPYAEEWFSAIQEEAEDPARGIGFQARTSVTEIQPGDIMASAYSVSGDTGHVMVIGEIRPLASRVAPPYPIPGVSLVNRYQVLVYDATKSIHGDFSSSTPDSRYKKQWNGKSWVADQGLGSGYIALYEDAATGAPVAWAWNTSKTTSSFYYAVTPPPDSSLGYRPLAIGFLTGL